MNESYHDIPDSTTKICTKCGVEKTLDQFSVQSKSKDGLRTQCKACSSIAFKQHNSMHPRIQRNVPLPLPEGVTSKICLGCSTEKPLSDFAQAKHERFGVRARCKLCISENDKLKRRQNAAPRPLPPTIKVCIICNIEKSIENFYKAGATTRRECKDCFRVKHNRYNFQKGNAERKQLPLFVFSRICTKCGVEKPIEEFAPSKYLPHGIHSRCKPCAAEDVQHRALIQVDLPVPAVKKCGRCSIEKPLDGFAVSTGYGKHGRSSICSECSSKRYQENRAKYGATAKKWRENNPLKDRKRSQNYAARKKQASITDIDYQRIIDRDGYFCYICERAIDPLAKGKNGLSFDHVKPLAGKGENKGAHSEENLKPVHFCCNSRKQARPFFKLTAHDRRGPDA